MGHLGHMAAARAPRSRHLEWATPIGRMSHLVLDEADRLLDEGFEEDIRAITKLASRREQTMMFSATWSARTEEPPDTRAALFYGA